MNLSKLIKKEILFIIITSISVLIALLGLTYGYVVYNSNNTETNVTVGSGDFILFYTDNQVISGTNIEPGWSQTKTITVENRGKKNATYNLIWQKIINGVELEISGTCTSSITNKTCSNIQTKTVPIFTTEVTNKKIKTNIEIEPGETQTYVITLKFLEEASLQENYSVSKSFRGTLNINVSTESNLYNVMKTLAEEGTYASTYSGNDTNDTYGETARKPVYYVRTKTANNTTQASTLLNSNTDIISGSGIRGINVKFAGFCWQIYRTTDTGGVKLIYNGEYVSGTGCKAQNTTDTHKGIIGAGASASMIGDYMYSDTFTYDTTAGTFTLVNPIVSNWSTNKDLLGKYTCKTSSSTSTCSTLYYINTIDRTNANSAYYASYTIGDTGNAQIGTSPFNKYDRSPAYVGYMFGDIAYEEVANSAPTSGVIMGNDVYWNGSNYVLKDGDNDSSHTYSGSQEANYHYTCNTTSATCTGGKVRYYYLANYYTELTNGDKVEDAISKMLTNSTNTHDSAMKAYLENWYYNNLRGYEDYIDQDAVYCNDRSITSLGGWSKSGSLANTSANYLQFNNYGTITTLGCTNNTDKFSVSNANAQLKYPIGLASAPEMNLINNNNVRKTSQYNWLVSPRYYSYFSSINYLSSSGTIYSQSAPTSQAARPVITLSNATDFASGDGSLGNPYVIE